MSSTLGRSMAWAAGGVEGFLICSHPICGTHSPWEWTSTLLIATFDDTAAFSNAWVDWRETNDSHRVDLPGARKDEVRVQVEDGNVLQISGERMKEKEEMDNKCHRVERRRGSFTRWFRLPVNVDLKNIKSSLENGVLSVIVPQKQSEQSRNVRFIDVA